MKHDKWEARIRRANHLASVHPFAAEGLRFYQRVAQAQKSLSSDFESYLGPGRTPREPGSLRQDVDLFVLLPRFASFVAAVEQAAPDDLAHSACELRAKTPEEWSGMLAQFLAAESPAESGLPPAESLLCWTFLQPYAECLADHTERRAIHATPSRCPLCDSAPQVGVLRPEGDGAKRSLVCALCAHEWEYRRIVCPACGEENVEKLAVYSSEKFPHVRVEACDSCRHYLTTVDLTKDGHAIPVVDELATIPLNLWAAEHDYAKSHTNLLGL